MFAEICVSSFPWVSYELLADATSRPSTSATIVPTNPIPTLIESRESLCR